MAYSPLTAAFTFLVDPYPFMASKTMAHFRNCNPQQDYTAPSFDKQAEVLFAVDFT